MGRRQLALDLRKLRMAAGLTIDDVARHLECSPAKVSRFETGAVKVGIQDLRAILELYGVEGPEREELFTLVRQARARGWWQSFADVVPPDSTTFFGMEDGAASIAQHSTSLVPGLLQTEAYARSLIGSLPAVPNGLIERRVELRVRRQQLLTRRQPPTLHTVLDEAALCRMIGGAAVMADQLDQLLEVARRPNVTLQVLPFSSGAHPAAGVSFTVFGFPDPSDAHVVYREQLDRNNFLDHPSEVAPYLDALAEASRIAESAECTIERITARRSMLRPGE